MSRNQTRSEISPHIRAVHSRNVCKMVLDAYHELKSSVAGSQAIDYQHILGGGSGAMYGDHERSMAGINFMADVENVAKHTLNPASFAIFRDLMLNQYPDYTKQSVAFMSIQAKMGKAFEKHGLYPAGAY